MFSSERSKLCWDLPRSPRLPPHASLPLVFSPVSHCLPLTPLPPASAFTVHNDPRVSCSCMQLYNGDGDDHIGVNSARQQIGGTDGSDGPRKVSAHPNPVGVGQRSLHGRRHDYPHNGGPEVITHERSDPVPQTSVVGYNDAASFPPPPSWDGDRNWNSDGAGRDGRPGFGGGAETERERFARRSGGGMDGNESRKALANGAPPVYAGYGVSHGGSLARGAQSEAGVARRGEGQSSSSHSRQRSDGDGRRGVWAGASRDPSRLAGGRGRDVVDGGRRLGNQRLDGAREGTDGDRNDGIGERTGAGGGGGERIGRGGGGEIAGSGGTRFHGWSERKRPLENIGAEDGTRGSPKKVMLDSVGQSSWCYSSYSPA